MTDRCETCMYWHFTDSYTAYEGRWLRRGEYIPAVVVCRLNPEYVVRYARDWCGKFNPIEHDK